MPTPGPLELVIILVIALIVLGPGRLPDVGSALGKSIREFRKASSDIQEATKFDTSPLPPTPPTAAPTAPAAAPPVAAPDAAPAAPPAAAAPEAAPETTPSVAPAAAPAPAPEAIEANPAPSEGESTSPSA